MLIVGASAGIPALGQLQEGDALTPVIAGLPRSVSVVIVSSKPSAVLGAVSVPWRRLGPLATGLGTDSLKSWSALAKRVGYEPGEAFEHLTSGGLAVVIAPVDGEAGGQLKIEGAARGGNVGLDADVDAHWAVLSVVKGDVAARVRERFKASPHTVIGGLPVLSVEDGRYALVCRGLGEGAEAGGREVLALTPMEDRAFLESIVSAVEAVRPKAGVVAAADKTLGGTGAFARGKRTVADAVILANEPERGREAWLKATVVACSLAERTWTFDAVTADTREGVAPGEATALLPAEASVLFDAWAPSAGAMLVGSRFDAVDRALSGAGVANDVASRFQSGVQAACIYLGPSAANVKNGTVGGGVSVWGAVRVKDRASLPVSVIDTLGSGVAAGIEQGWNPAADGGGDGAKQDREPVDPRVLAAMPETALRVVSVKMSPGGPLIGGASSSVPGSVAWFVCPAPAGDGGGGEHGACWVAMGIEPRGDADAVGARHRGLSGVLSGAGEPVKPERTWLVRGVLRPSVLTDVLPAPMGFAVGLSGITTVKEVRLDSWAENAGADAGVRTKVVVEWR